MPDSVVKGQGTLYENKFKKQISNLGDGYRSTIIGKNIEYDIRVNEEKSNLNDIITTLQDNIFKYTLS